MRVVEVVERVEEPVLERELSGMGDFGRNVGIDGGRGGGRQAARPELVITARIERVTREIEVILEAVDEIVRRRPDLDEVAGPPRTAECHRRLVEEHVDIGWDVRLPRPTFDGLRDETNDRCVLRGERRLAGRVRGR